MKILLTGSNGQLGSKISKRLKQNGCELIGIDIQDCTKNVHLDAYHQVDITDENKVQNLFSKYNDLDCLINNAGIGVFTPTLQRTVEEFKSVMEVNLLGTFLMCQAYIKSKKKNGRIVNIASMYGHQSSDKRIYGSSGRNNSEVYSATKAGVISLTKYLATNFADMGFVVNSVSPGGIFNSQANDFLENYKQKSPQSRLGEPEEIAEIISFLAVSAPVYLNGEDLLVDGGFTKW